MLEGLEAVRKRPGMYIGSTGPRGLHHLVYEVVDNSVDEALAGYCTHIEIILQADGGVKVVDNGRGIPVDMHPTEHKPTVEVVMTILHAGGKFGGGGYAVSGGLHGVGISVVNALSSRVDTEVRRQGHVWRMSFADGGKPQGGLVKGEETTETGTTQTFYPDASDLRVHRIRLRDPARTLPADGLPEQGPAHHADRRTPRRGGSRPRTRTWTSTSSRPKAKSPPNSTRSSTSTTTACWTT